MTGPTYYGLARVFYPLQRGRLTLRTEQDWNLDLAPVAVGDDGQRFDFLLSHSEPYLACKPCLHDEDGDLHWAAGANKLLIFSERPQDLYPHFFVGNGGRITDVLLCPSQVLGRPMALRVYLPAGYSENHLKRYPVVYMHDGRNLFFPQESFLGQEWRIDENLDLLDSMNLIDRMIVVGIHAGDRAVEYTQPGYERYGRAVVNDLKPWVDRSYRTLSDASDTAVMGASLGGVVAFYLGWEHPGVFGNVACLSSTFGYHDDLLVRARRDPLAGRRELKLYLDSGWPADNYEVTLGMVNALLERGFQLGRDVLHLAFPHAVHGEAAWAARVHIPLQLFSGKVRRAAQLRALPTPTTERHASKVFHRPVGSLRTDALGPGSPSL